jgi:hypothetical protein
MLNNNELRGVLTVLRKYVFDPLSEIGEEALSECTNTKTHAIPEFYPAQMKISISNYLDSLNEQKLRKELEPYLNLVSGAANDINMPVYIDFSELIKISYYEIAVIAETITTVNRNNQDYFYETEELLPFNNEGSITAKISAVLRSRSHKKKLDTKFLAKKLYSGLIENIELTEGLGLREAVTRWNNGHKSLGLFVNMTDKALELMAEKNYTDNRKYGGLRSYPSSVNGNLAVSGKNSHL